MKIDPYRITLLLSGYFSAYTQHEHEQYTFNINLALRPACTIFAGKQTPAWAGCGSAMCKINLILPRLALSLSYGYYRFP